LKSQKFSDGVVKAWVLVLTKLKKNSEGSKNE
jgi:hypothetical protein